ncbi:hypothetical protein JXB84_002102 [Escherichia coli]|nr:hypothetical protein [Escherichia coli]
MSKITKDQAKDLRNAFQCWQQDYDPAEDKEQYDMFGLGMVAMDALLASLEAEPVSVFKIDHESSLIKHVKKVVSETNAPPAPVSVPDEVTTEDCPAFVKYDVTDVDEAWSRGWNACRAAMLQGAEPGTTAYKLPFEQWLSQQTGTIDVECGCVMTEVFFHWLRVAYEAGNSPHFREIVNSSTNNCRENAETSTKCWCHTCRPVTFADSRFVVCPECGNKRCPYANDHRNACTGSNDPGQEGSAYPAAPQQEVK